MKLFLLALFVSSTTSFAATYATAFPLTENPISESGQWINGRVVGLDWSNCATSGGKVIGQQNNGAGPNYNDSTALLAGVWGPNQTAEVTIFKGSVINSDFPEMEIRLNSTLAAHSSTGIEVLLSAKTDNSAYLAVVRWNGALGDFTTIASDTSQRYGSLVTGDKLKASRVGNTINVYTNGVLALTATDSVYNTGGSPGVGFDHNGSSTEDSTFGFTSFTATDGLVSPPKISISGSMKLSGKLLIGQ